ncbi:MAG: hypothetical protein OEU51_07820 [Gammaproteobacteria bacterium]|nr:hypothetical protein [Gammaproteobacteria bacterium]
MTDRRSIGQRRWDLDTGFPLIDSDGVTVVSNRRHMSDRRLENISLEERQTLFSEMLPADLAQARNY